MKLKKRSVFKDTIKNMTTRRNDIIIDSQMDPETDLISGMTKEDFLKALKKDISIYNNIVFSHNIDDEFCLQMVQVQPRLINRLMPGMGAEFLIKAIEVCEGVLEEIDKSYFQDPKFLLKTIRIKPEYIGLADERIVSKQDKKSLEDFYNGKVKFKDVISKINMLSPVVEEFVINEAQRKATKIFKYN